MRIRRNEEGAALVEFALIAIVLFTLLFGIIEFGLAFRDWLSVTSATREGARVAAAAANDPDADCAILNAATGPLLAVPTETAETFRVIIYEAGPGGTYPGDTGNVQIYKPNTGAPLDPVDCDSSWDRLANNYPPADREVAVDALDTIGVRINFDHNWVTGLFGSTTSWTDDAIMRVEPRAFSGP